MAEIATIAPLALALAAAGLVAGLLAGVFGIGGGAILVPVFYQLFGFLQIDEAVRMHLAVGTSLAIIVPTSLRSFASHRARGTVDMALLRTYLLAVPAGVAVAALVFASISAAGLQIVFAVIAVAVGIKLVFARHGWQIADDLPGPAGRFAAGAIIGFVSALMGIGGGVMNNTFMTLYGRPILQAVATSSGVGVLISIPGLFGAMWAGWGAPGLPPLSTGHVNWLAVAVIIPVTLAVAPLGVRIAHRLQKRQLELAFGVFMFVVAARFVVSAVSS
ncbi:MULTISPECIES: sulfite exporter TauE/SafE family protein [unclassified Roseitalea]|uniref:sulfite exporter TauE/SafE family protein n=1 Tax=unclassified Roseitalea TaxID=2639107 RepID=UPI00273DA108|nr:MULTISPECIES: sulfite exporter TauE/SafE family protein [unclassified Roseitalea]